MTSFSIVLPSNSSMESHPKNTLSNYTTVLSKGLELDGDWEVALTEIQFPRTWYNVTSPVSVDKYEYTFRNTNDPFKAGSYLQLMEGYYDDGAQIIDQINNELTDTISEEYLATKLVYDTASRKCRLLIGENNILGMNSRLASLLGFGDDGARIFNQFDNRREGRHAIDVDQGFYGLFVYCDILESIPVGDTRAPLLKIVDVSGKFGEIIHRIYSDPQYIPLGKKEFESIEINIRDDTGRLVPFQFGKVVMTLHFRRSKNPYFLKK